MNSRNEKSLELIDTVELPPEWNTLVKQYTLEPLRKGDVTIDQFALKTGVSNSSARRILSAMLQAGKIEEVRRKNDRGRAIIAYRVTKGK